jgi:hypothetical protein
MKEPLDILHLVSSTPTKHQRGGLQFNHETLQHHSKVTQAYE